MKNRKWLSTSTTATDGGDINLTIVIKVSMQEISSWPPDRIEAFFRGLSVIMTVKGNTERESKGVEEDTKTLSNIREHIRQSQNIPVDLEKEPEVDKTPRRRSSNLLPGSTR